MRLDAHGEVVRVVLSRRNLKVLLAKLDGAPAGSACTITYVTREGIGLSVTAEPDEVHYANPERDDPVPGRMHPATEAALLERP